VFELEPTELFLLARAHLLRRQAGAVQPLQSLAGPQQQLDELALSLTLRAPCIEQRQSFALDQPALETFFFHHGRERLVEARVARRVRNLMRELVEERAYELRIAPLEHRAQHWILEMPERRIGGHAVDRRILAAPAQPPRVALCAALGEVAAINDAAGVRKAPAQRLDRELLGREHIPYDVRTLQVDVAAIAAVIRQPELARGEIARFGDVLQPRAQRRRRGRIHHQLRDRLTLRRNLHLTARRLQQITTRETQAGQQQEQT